MARRTPPAAANICVTLVPGAWKYPSFSNVLVMSESTAGAVGCPGIAPLLYVNFTVGFMYAMPYSPSAYGVHSPHVGPLRLRPPSPYQTGSFPVPVELMMWLL